MLYLKFTSTRVFSKCTKLTILPLKDYVGDRKNKFNKKALEEDAYWNQRLAWGKEKNHSVGIEPGIPAFPVYHSPI